MIVQMLTFVLIGILFLAVPDFLSRYWLVPMTSVVLLWLGWDVLKVVAGLIGGALADKGSVWIVCFAGLIAQSLFVFLASEAAESAMLKKGDWKLGWFLVSVGFIFAFGTTTDGFVGGPFVKLMTEVERLIGQACYEELFTRSVTVIALGEAAGNLYAGWLYGKMGFGMCLYLFAWAHLICMLVCAYAMQGLVRPPFEQEKKPMDAP